jgi:hypothetical protein
MHTPQPIVQKRINCVYLKAELNLSNQFISSIAGLHYNTVAYLIMVYENNGCEGLLSNN